MLRNFKVLLIVLVAIFIAGSTYAFAAANVVPDSAADYKANSVPGFTVTDIVYDLDDANPTLVNAITFKVGPTTGTVEAALVEIQTADAGIWKVCTLGEAVAHVIPVTCTYGTPLELVDITALNVVASSTTNPADS